MFYYLTDPEQFVISDAIFRKMITERIREVARLTSPIKLRLATDGRDFDRSITSGPLVAICIEGYGVELEWAVSGNEERNTGLSFSWTDLSIEPSLPMGIFYTRFITSLREESEVMGAFVDHITRKQTFSPLDPQPWRGGEVPYFTCDRVPESHTRELASRWRDQLSSLKHTHLPQAHSTSRQPR
jgi:hypothetical protein